MEHDTHAPLRNAFALFNGIRATSSAPDHGEAVLTLGPDSLNPYGLLHGGAYYTMADCACGIACRTDGRDYVTIHGGLNFIRSVRSGTVTARAVIRHRGHSTCQADVEITDENDTLLATGDFIFFCIGKH